MTVSSPSLTHRRALLRTKKKKKKTHNLSQKITEGLQHHQVHTLLYLYF